MPDHRLLIVEDEAIVALDIEERLTAMGYQLVGQAVSGAEALKLTQEQRPDLVLMDIRLQGDMDGITVAQEIRHRFHIPVIFLTAYAEDDTLERATLAEPFGYLLKPFNARELKSAIEIALYKHRSEEEIRHLNRLYDVLSQVNQTIVRVQSREELLAEVCRVMVERGGIDLAWVGWLDPAVSFLNPVAAFGHLFETLKPVEVTADASISSQAVNSGRPAVSNQCLPGHCVVSSPGSSFNSCGSFPLRFQGRIAGVLTLCASKPGFFEEREIDLLKEVCLDVSFGLDKIEADAQLEESNGRLRSIYETVQAGILVQRADGVIIAANKVCSRIFEMDITEIIGKTSAAPDWHMILEDGTPVPEDQHPSMLTIRTGQPIRNAVRGIFADDPAKFRWLLVNTEPIVNPQTQNLREVTITFQDITALKQAQEALRQERNKFRNVLENIRFGVYIVNARYEIEYLNNFLAKDFGRVDGRRCYQYFHDQTEPCPWCKNPEVFAGRSVRWEWESAKTGRIFDLFDMPLVNEDGSISKLAIIHDITERKRVDQALRDNEQFLTDIFDNIQDGICVLDTDLHIVRVNPALARFPQQEAIVGRKCYEEFHRRQEPCEICPVRETLRSGQAEQGIVKNFTPDGQAIDVEIHAFPLRDQVGRIQGAIEYVRDVTQRLRMEQELRESELFLQETQKIARLGGWMANPHTDYLKWTNGVYDMTEAPRDYAPPLSEGIKCFLPEYIPILNDHLARCLATGEPFSLECRVITTTGKWLWAEVRGLAPIVEGERTNVIGTIQDITDRKQAEATRLELETRLFQAQKMEAIGTLAGGIAHDFNNILWAIQGYTEMAAGSLADPKQAADFLNQVLLASQRAKDLVGQILVFSRKLEGDKQPLLLKLIVAEVLKLVRASLPSTIEIHPQLFSKTPILADATQIHQILMNLATNAFHAMEDTGGSLDISLTDVRIDQPWPAVQGELSPGQYVALTIKDTGPGIDPELLPRIFEPYFTTKEIGKGTGLGLATVLGIVKSHGSEIVLDSQPGQGTTFTLYFPAIPAAPADIAPADLDMTLQGNGCILFVDDEPPLVELGKSALTRLGYQVIGVGNSREALEVFRAQPQAFNLIITDLTMPQMTGLDLARACQTIRPGVPVILCTGYAERVSQEIPRELGVREILLKPLGLQQLGQIVKKILTT